MRTTIEYNRKTEPNLSLDGVQIYDRVEETTLVRGHHYDFGYQPKAEVWRYVESERSEFIDSLSR